MRKDNFHMERDRIRAEVFEEAAKMLKTMRNIDSEYRGYMESAAMHIRDHATKTGGK